MVRFSSSIPLRDYRRRATACWRLFLRCAATPRTPRATSIMAKASGSGIGAAGIAWMITGVRFTIRSCSHRCRQHPVGTSVTFSSGSPRAAQRAGGKTPIRPAWLLCDCWPPCWPSHRSAYPCPFALAPLVSPAPKRWPWLRRPSSWTIASLPAIPPESSTPPFAIGRTRTSPPLKKPTDRWWRGRG